MAFRKFVETGRVAFIAEGVGEGKLCAIVNVIDQNRVLVDGPKTGIVRQEVSLKRLHLTNFKLKFPWSAPTKTVRKVWESDNIDEKWSKTSWSKRVEARNIRANLTDFERFKLARATRTRNKMRRNVYITLLENAKNKNKKPSAPTGKPAPAPKGKALAGKKKPAPAKK